MRSANCCRNFCHYKRAWQHKRQVNMAGFSSVKQMVDAEENGQYTLSSWRKTPSQATTIGIWFDLSMSPGNPIPQYYASSPLISVPMGYAELGGMYHGKNLVGKRKYLRQLLAISSSGTPLPMPMILCDYLLYYPQAIWTNSINS